MSQSTVTRSFVLFFLALSLFGCVADTRGFEPECRCVVESGAMLYDLPCGVQACLDGVGVVCMDAEEAWPVDIECDAGESTFEEGVCEADESGAVPCEDQRGESACESTTGCSWLPAACTYTDDCEAWSDSGGAEGRLVLVLVVLFVLFVLVLEQLRWAHRPGVVPLRE